MSANPSSGPYHQLRIERVIDETADARSFVVEIPDALRDKFAYRAGQFLTFRVTVDGERLVRCYSLASSPDTEREHKVTVKRIDDGRVSNWMNDNLVAGSELDVMKPTGRFCLAEGRTGPVVLFGGGSGVTPVISILKTALATTSRDVKLVYANRDADSVIFRAELDQLVAANGSRLEVVHRLDDLHGFLDVDTARQLATVGAGADFYICGPGPFMDVVEEGLKGLAIPEDQMFIERFESPTGSETPAAALDEGAAVAEAGEEGGSRTVTIHLDGETHTFPYNEGETVLEAARRAGIDTPFACEDGYCGCCMAMLKEGDLEMRMNDGGVDDSQISQGWRLTCQGVPKSPKVTVEYPD